MLPVAIGCCKAMLICLGEGWEDKTVSGRAVVVASLNNTFRRLGYGEYMLPYRNVRCSPTLQYSLTIDDDQFLTIPESEDKYRPECSDIVDVNPFPCGIIQDGEIPPITSCVDIVTELPAECVGYRKGCFISLEGGDGTPADGMYLCVGGAWKNIDLY